MIKERGSISSEDKTEEQYRAELQNMQNHGIMNFTNTNIYDEKGTILPLQIKNSLFGKVPLFYYGLTVGQKGENVEDKLKIVKNLMRDSASYVSDIYIYGKEEVNANEMEAQRSVWELIRSQGAKMYTASHPKWGISQAVGDILDVFNLAGADAEEATQIHYYGHQAFSYANPQVGEETPEKYRRNFGLLLWQRGYDGAFNYAYQDGFNSIWNDFDNAIYRDHVFAYPTTRGVIDTIQWEGWREGVDDMRYLTTLLNLTNKARENGEDTTVIDSWLSDLKKLDLEKSNLNEVRLDIIDHIMSFILETSS